ncbi:MAG: hypothetical protein IJF53_02595 [Clostridia bacterium]|nr:hypothetical protein [Clostridia bacterium]MBR6736289.1 hypothetical protein [Oscillospiraceae bacterium]
MNKKIYAGKNRRKIASKLGLICYILMLIGLIAVVYFTVNSVRKMFDRDDGREQYEEFISPVVMMDPIPFEDVNEADKTFVLESSVWSALSGPNRANYRYDDMGLLLLPASDVDVASVRLFGPDVDIEHASFEDMDGTYLYDPEIAAYRIPVISKLAYSPAVTEINKEGENLLLTVGYVAPGNMWTTVVLDEEGDPEPEKYMIYEMHKNGENYFIKAVRDIDPDAPPVS